VGAGRFTGTHIHGQCFTYCFQIDNSLDIQRFDDIHIWPYWSNVGPVIRHMQANTDMIITKRNDTPQWGRVFGYGMRSCVKMDSSPSGITSGMTIDSFICDASKYGLWVTGNNSDGRIANAYLSGEGMTIPGSHGIFLEGQGYTLAFGQARIYFQSGCAITATNTTQGGLMTIGALLMQQINLSHTFYGAIVIANTSSGATAHQLKLATQPQLNNSSTYMLGGTTNAYMSIPGYETIVNTLFSNRTYNFSNAATHMYMYTNVGPVSNVTIRLPNSRPDAEVLISTFQPITRLKIVNNPEESWPLIGMPTSLQPGESLRIRWIYGGSLVSGSWVRM
jgi:hypothetical protein